jgi:hypothetical protein
VLGSRGREHYLRKRQEVLQSPSHFVEIDLLRGGAPIRVDAPLRPHHYAVQISRAERRPLWKVWTILLSDKLPVVKIPLKGDDPDAPLDLQLVLNRSYERAAYDADVDYTRPPNPPLEGEYAAWGENVIAAATK